MAAPEIAWVPEEGAYREIIRRQERRVIGGLEIAVDVAEAGDLYVWVDEAPDDPEDGSGHFQLHDGATEYRAVITGG